MFKLVLEKAEEPEIKLPTSAEYISRVISLVIGHKFEQAPGVGDGQGSLAFLQSIGL